MKTVTICGSMKYEREMQIAALKLETKRGYAVLQPVYNVEKEKLNYHDTAALKKACYAKIDISDAIFVVDIQGYIGESTKEEIKYAKERGKEIIKHSNYDL